MLGTGGRGISGGEKRRLSVAIQLLTNPTMLFCDEPTSGLDSSSSFELLKTLTLLAKTERKTIVASIHQPRSEIFKLLADNDGQLVLLSAGDAAYCGPVSQCIEWLGSIEGIDGCPSDMNPFDYMLDLSAIDYTDGIKEHISRERRTSLNSVRTRLTIAFVATVSQPFIFIAVMTYRTCNEVRVFDRERNDRWYGPLPYTISSWLQNLPVSIFASLDPFVYLALFVVIFLIFTWVALTLHVVKPSASAEHHSFLEYVIDLIKMSFNSSYPPVKDNQSSTALVSHINRAATTLVDGNGEKPNHLVALTINPEGTHCVTIDTAPTSALERMSTAHTTIQEPSRLTNYGRMLLQVEPVLVCVDNLSLTSATWKWIYDPHGTLLHRWKKREVKRSILNEVSLTFPPGELTAILGASGAGKTSLISAILKRGSLHLNKSGDIWFNGSKNPSLRKINTVCAYVRQEDSFLFTHLTIRETLQYAAALSMNKYLTKSERVAKVEAIMEFMGLLECADVLVGNSESTGISGGQRRRVSIALQLIIEPSCLVLDEPTTGLDAMAALGIVQTLKAIAQTGRTVICTIHQPRSAIWNEFDNVVVLMDGGRLGYAGKKSHALSYFAQLGHVPPEYTNFPDFILDTASINYRSTESESVSRRRVDELADMFRKRISRPATIAEDLPKLSKNVPHYAAFFKAVNILSRRSFANTFRQKGLYYNRVFLPVCVMGIAAPFFSGLDRTPAGLFERLTFSYQLSFYSGNGLLISTALFPQERNLAFHEISNGMYGVTSFLFSYIVNEVPLTLIAGGLVTAGCFLIIPLQRGIAHAAVLYFVCATYLASGESLAIALSAWTNNDGVMVNISNCLCLLFLLMAGVTNASVPHVFEMFNYVSLLHYGSVAIAISEMSGMQVQCTEQQKRDFECLIETGDDMLKNIGFDNYTTTECLVMLAVLTIVYRAMAWASLLVKARTQGWSN
ncbi:hypothetical protein BGZ92_002152 [Podila epicladia]|nr:hypothetical protein BGZ92_002152 [Podila epicladia]